MEFDLEQIQQQCRCNWCLNALANTSGEITDANLIDTGRKFPDGKPAYALYCNECLADQNRVKQPKSVLSTALKEINIESLPPHQQTQTTTTITTETHSNDSEEKAPISKNKR